MFESLDKIIGTDDYSMTVSVGRYTDLIVKATEGLLNPNGSEWQVMETTCHGKILMSDPTLNRSTKEREFKFSANYHT